MRQTADGVTDASMMKFVSSFSRSMHWLKHCC